VNEADRNRLALLLLNDGGGPLSRRSAVSNAFTSAVAPDPTQAEFLRSEKDTRPFYETEHRASVLPLVMSGYNNSVGYGAPVIAGGRMWDVLGDITSGRPTTMDELRHAAEQGAGAALLSSPFVKAPAGALRSGAMRSQPPAPSRSLDPLGYYSKALEEAQNLPSQASPDQILATLRNKGVKPGEIEATGLAEALMGKPSVSRDDVVRHLTENRVGLNEVRYGGNSLDGPTKWSTYSLDPSNPTYRETVLHLPRRGEKLDKRRMEIEAIGRDATPEQRQEWADIMNRLRPDNRDVEGAQPFRGMPDFQSGHFPESNIVGHLMTSVNKHEGKPVYTIDQIQSDWGQKLRNGGVRDEAKIASLRERIEPAKKAYEDVTMAHEAKGRALLESLPPAEYGRASTDGGLFTATKDRSLPEETRKAASQWLTDQYNLKRGDEAEKLRLLTAELRTAEAATHGHPLVNTTDQWTNTVLRRAIQQAMEANAEKIAIPSGSTVLSYNPGKERGMKAFYDDIVPKNLAKILGGLDKAGLRRAMVDQLDTPSGPKGSGFTLFDLTPAMRDAARKGMPLFAAPHAGLLPLLMQQNEQGP